MTQPTTLARRLGLGDAVWIGLGSMVGAGLFASFAPAARASGGGLLLALAVAGLVAFCNATSSAQLAARYPSAGGTYVYGREELGPWAGFLAGWGFVIGKTASCCAMALTFGAYVTGGGPWERPVGVLGILLLGLVNLRGVTRTAWMARAIVVVVLALLAVALVVAWTSPAADAGRLARLDVLPHGPYGLLQAAGLLFFAFAGYARIATMGEEVREPERTIPRAIPLALGLALLVYLLVGTTLLSVADAGQVGASATPLSLLTAGQPWGSGLIRVAAALAALGALLSLVAGVGRTTLAMARERDLPHWLAAVNPRHRVPHHAEIALMVVVSVVVLLVDLRGAIGFSSFGVLFYYLVANASACHQTEGRRWPRWLQVAGMVGCVLLALSLPWQSVVAGIAVFALGIVHRLIARRGR